MSGRECKPCPTAVRLIPALLLVVAACGCTPVLHYIHQHTPVGLLHGDPSAYYQCGRCGQLVDDHCGAAHACTSEPPFLGFPVTRWHLLPCEPQPEPSLPLDSPYASEPIPRPVPANTTLPAESRGPARRLQTTPDDLQATEGHVPLLPPVTNGSQRLPAATGSSGLHNVATSRWPFVNGPVPRLPASLTGVQPAHGRGSAPALANTRYRQYPADMGTWGRPHDAAVRRLPPATRTPAVAAGVPRSYRDVPAFSPGNPAFRPPTFFSGSAEHDNAAIARRLLPDPRGAVRRLPAVANRALPATASGSRN